MQEELTLVRTLQEQERASYARHKERFAKKVEEQRSQMAQMRDAAATREHEMMSEVEKERKSARLARDEFEKEKRIHEELIRVIGCQAVDYAFLTSHLDPKEYRLVKNAERPRSAG
jgi:hypothetical protein